MAGFTEVKAASFSSFFADVLIVVHGYESRSRYLHERLQGPAPETWSLFYEDSPVLSYEENEQYFLTVESARFSLNSDEWTNALTGRLLEKSTELGRALNVSIDFSVANRDTISQLVALVANVGAELEVTFWYSNSAYAVDEPVDEQTVLINRPARMREGWSPTPDSPLACVMCLGFEGRFAEAAIETLEPTSLYLFRATGADARFDQLVSDRNAQLLERESRAARTFEMNAPLGLFRLVESVVANQASQGRVVIVPLGPKLFALVAMLVASGFPEAASVWRISAGSSRLPVDRAGSGDPIGLTLKVEIGSPPSDEV